MSYLKSLTDYLINNVSGKEKIQVWVESDTLEFSSSEPDNGLESHQVINFVISDVNVDSNALRMHVANWVRTYLPDFDGMGLPKPVLHIEPLEDGRFDVAGVIEVKETLTFEPDPNGVWQVDGQNMTIKSDFQDPDLLVSELVTFDGVTQDTELSV